MRQVCSEASNESFAGKPVCFLRYEGEGEENMQRRRTVEKKRERVKKKQMKRGILKGMWTQKRFVFFDVV